MTGKGGALGGYGRRIQTEALDKLPPSYLSFRHCSVVFNFTSALWSPVYMPLLGLGHILHFPLIIAVISGNNILGTLEHFIAVQWGGLNWPKPSYFQSFSNSINWIKATSTVTPLSACLFSSPAMKCKERRAQGYGFHCVWLLAGQTPPLQRIDPLLVSSHHPRLLRWKDLEGCTEKNHKIRSHGEMHKWDIVWTLFPACTGARPSLCIDEGQVWRSRCIEWSLSEV